PRGNDERTRNRHVYPQTSLSVTASVPMRRQAQRSSQRNGTSVVTEMKSRQAAKIRELGQSLIDAGFVKAQYRRLTEGVAKKREGFVGEGVIRLASRPRQPHVRTSFGTDVRDNVCRSHARSARTQKPEGLTQPPTPRALGPPRVPPTSRRSRSPSSRSSCSSTATMNLKSRSANNSVSSVKNSTLARSTRNGSKTSAASVSS